MSSKDPVPAMQGCDFLEMMKVPGIEISFEPIEYLSELVVHFSEDCEMTMELFNVERYYAMSDLHQLIDIGLAAFPECSVALSQISNSLTMYRNTTPDDVLAKIDDEHLRQDLIDSCLAWTDPPMEGETKAAAEVSKLPTVTITKYLPEHQLKAMGMKLRHCHTNCLSMQDHPEVIGHVVGWIFTSNFYILHSVIRKSDNKLYCVTPTYDWMESFEFIPDDEIDIDTESSISWFSRKGIQIITGLRLDPAATIANSEKKLKRLYSDMDPWEAYYLPIES